MALTLRPGMLRLWPFRVNLNKRLLVSSVSIKVWMFSFILWSSTQQSGLSFIDGPSRANFHVSKPRKGGTIPSEECPSFVKVFLAVAATWLGVILVGAVLFGLLWWVL